MATTCDLCGAYDHGGGLCQHCTMTACDYCSRSISQADYNACDGLCRTCIATTCDLCRARFSQAEYDHGDGLCQHCIEATRDLCGGGARDVTAATLRIMPVAQLLQLDRLVGDQLSAPGMCHGGTEARAWLSARRLVRATLEARHASSHN